jgi:hypothetical protein
MFTVTSFGQLLLALKFETAAPAKPARPFLVGTAKSVPWSPSI